MKTTPLMLSTALLMGLLTTSLVYAQPVPLPAQPPALMADGGPRPLRPGGPRGYQPEAMTSLTTLTGTVDQLTANEDGILNGFTVKGNAAPQTVRFGAHLGQQVNAAVRAGSRVTVTGYSRTSPEGEAMFQLVKLDAGKTQVVDAPPAMPQTPTTPTQQTVNGKVTDFLIDRDGRANGLVLNDQTVIKVPPHVAGQLVTLAPKGSAVTVDGYVQPLGEGQVQLQRRTILRASVLTVGGQSYLIQ